MPVVARLAWPSVACTSESGAPRSIAWVVWAWRSQWGDTLPGMPARVDRFAALDIGVEYTINPHAALRADWSQMINKANTVLYESRYRGGSVTLLLNH